MRIGIDIRELEKDKSTGIGRYLSNFLNFASKYDTTNEYILFGNQHTRSDLNFTGMKIKIIPEFLTGWWDQKILSREIKKENIQLFYSPYFKGPLFSRARLIITIHDLYPFFFRAGMRIKNSFLKFYIKKIAVKADKIITVSNHMKDQIVEVLRVNPAKVEVVYNSVAKIFRPLENKKSANKIRKFDIEKDFLLYVGNLKSHKNVINLVAAYSFLPQELKEKHHLVIVGKKDRNYGVLLRDVQKKGLRSNIIFTDLVDDEELLYLYNSATAFITTSLHEGFGVPLIEAMACGVPVIASDIPTLAEVVGKAGILVDPCKVDKITQAIAKVLTDGALRNNMAEKAVARARQFSIETAANKILGIFEKEKSL